jgi:hypothetical protein
MACSAELYLLSTILVLVPRVPLGEEAACLIEPPSVWAEGSLCLSLVRWLQHIAKQALYYDGQKQLLRPGACLLRGTEKASLYLKFSMSRLSV